MIEKSSSQMLIELTGALNQASGAASAFVHLTGNAPGFMVLRDSIDLLRQAVLTMSTAQVINGVTKH
jgi:hypothetical protein